MSYTQEDAFSLANAVMSGNVERVLRELQPERINKPIGGSAAAMAPLHLAAASGRRKLCRALLENGADPNVLTELKRQSPLCLALSNASTAPIQEREARVQCVGVLLSGGADPNISERYMGYAPLHYALHMLERAIAEVKSKGASLSGAQELATAVVELLVEHGADCGHIPCGEVSADPRIYLTPLQYAIKGGIFPAIKVFLDSSPVDMDQKTLAGRSLAQLAKTPQVRELLRSVRVARSVEVEMHAQATPIAHVGRAQRAPGAGML
jgi:hypothetical protein